MAGISVIVRKEVSDAMSNKAFLLSLAVLMLNMALTGATSSGTYTSYFENEKARGNDTTTCCLIIIDTLIPHIKVLGALVAIAYGFNAINKERTEGNLKVLLSYPIYRDQVILGKLIAGFIIISLATVASIMVALTLHLYTNNIYIKPDPLFRFTVFTALSALFLSGYLGLSMLLSIASKDQKTTLLGMLLIIGVFNSYAFISFGRVLSDAVYGPELKISAIGGTVPMNPQALTLQNLVMRLSPAYGYEKTSGSLRFWSIRSVVEGDYVRIPSNVWSVISNNLFSIVLLTIIPIVTFTACYVLFTRRDIT